MSQCIRRVADGRLDILASKSWIRFKESGLCRSFAKLPEDQLHRYPSSTDHRLSHHYFWIYLNSISDCHSGLNVGRFVDGEARHVIKIIIATCQAGNPVFVHGRENQ